MENNGYIKLWRKMLNWEWYDDPNTKIVFLHLLLTANYVDKKWRGTVIKKGQTVTSYRKLAEELNLSEKNVRTAISHLKSTGEVASEKISNFTVISINNYADFQQDGRQTADKSADDGQADGRQTADKSADDGQADGRQTATTKEIKKEKNIKNKEKEINKEKESAEIPYGEIVDYLNEKAEKNYRVVDSVKALIAKRFSEGFSFEDFKTVIDVKCAKWKNDEKMNPYLRPETLFGQKFQNYLNEKPVRHERSYDIEKAIRQAEDDELVYIKNAERRLRQRHEKEE